GRVRERFANEVSVARSGFVSTTGAFGRPVRMPVLLLRQTGESCDLFHFLQGQDTSGWSRRRWGGGAWEGSDGPRGTRALLRGGWAPSGRSTPAVRSQGTCPLGPDEIDLASRL